MIVVYWLAPDETAGASADALAARHRVFAENELSAALAFAEGLRRQRLAGDRISHVSIQSELPQSVGPAGVSDPDPRYAHYKRRIDPALPLGRPRPGEEAGS